MKNLLLAIGLFSSSIYSQVINGDFSSDFASNADPTLGWVTENRTSSKRWKVNSLGQAQSLGSGSADKDLYQTLTLNPNTTYKLHYDFTNTHDGDGVSSFIAAVGVDGYTPASSNGSIAGTLASQEEKLATGSSELQFTTSATGIVTIYFIKPGEGGDKVTIDNVSVVAYISASDIIKNKYFSNDFNANPNADPTVDWVTENNANATKKWKINGQGQAQSVGNGTADKDLYQTLTLNAGVRYLVRFDYTITDDGDNNAKIIASIGEGGYTPSNSNGVVSDAITSVSYTKASGNGALDFVGPSSGQVTLSFVKPKEGADLVTIDNVTIEEYTVQPYDIKIPDVNAPNIIVMMCDDVGPECFTPYGQGKWVNKKNPAQKADYVTPNIQTMADNGVTFRYAFNNSVCTPSRVKIMTGRHNFRNYTKFKHMSANEITFGHIAKNAGYKTMVAGKWQLKHDDSAAEDRTEDVAYRLGFDNFVLHNFNGESKGRYANPKLWTNDTRIASIPEGEYWAELDNSLSWKLNTTDGTQAGGTVRNYGPDITSDYIVDFIEQNKDEKFFVYYPCILPHNPFDKTPDSNSNSVSNWVDMVHYIDKIVGKINSKLDELNLADNTLFIFTSDNGTNTAIHSELNGNFFPGGKGSIFNNGSWAPFIVQWKGEVTGMQVSNETVGLEDVLPTIVDAMGSSAVLPTVKRDGTTPTNFDGQSLVPYLKGETTATRDFTFVDYRTIGGSNPNKARYIRYKDYRYVDGEQSATDATDPNNITGWYLVGNDKPYDERFILDPENIPNQDMRFTIENYMEQTKLDGSVISNTRFDANYTYNPITLGVAPNSKSYFGNNGMLNVVNTEFSHSTGNVEFHGLLNEVVTVLVADVSGNVKMNSKRQVINGFLELDLTGLPDQAYIINVQASNGVLSKKVMKID